MIEEPAAHKDFIECLNGAAALLCLVALACFMKESRATDVMFIFDDTERI